MTKVFSGSAKLVLQGFLTKTLDLGVSPFSVPYTQYYSIANGVAANQCDMVWADTRTITASSTDPLDLADGLIDAYGDAIAFTAIKGMFIFAHSTNTNNLIIGNGTNPFVNWVGAGTHTVIVKPGGMFSLFDPTAGGYAVTDSTADTLQIANSSSGTSVVYDIILMGNM